MLIEIDNIIIKDRIRKDFGDIKELADDIKQNGLINPPVVTPIDNGKCELIAGERRLRAMKSLGYQQIEVRPMSIKDAEHQLNLEISENAVRKNWTMTEMLEIARRKERMSAIKGRENQASHTVSENSQKVDASSEAAKTIEVSDNTYRRMKMIDDNRELLDPSDFAEWDERKLSTNKVYQKIKARLQEAEQKAHDSMIEIQRMQNHNLLNKDRERLLNEAREAKERVKVLEERSNEAVFENKIINETDYFCITVYDFIKKLGGYIWLTEHINQMPDEQRKKFKNAVTSGNAWFQKMVENLGGFEIE